MFAVKEQRSVMQQPINLGRATNSLFTRYLKETVALPAYIELGETRLAKNLPRFIAFYLARGNRTDGLCERFASVYDRNKALIPESDQKLIEFYLSVLQEPLSQERLMWLRLQTDEPIFSMGLRRIVDQLASYGGLFDDVQRRANVKILTKTIFGEDIGVESEKLFLERTKDLLDSLRAFHPISDLAQSMLLLESQIEELTNQITLYERLPKGKLTQIPAAVGMSAEKIASFLIEFTKRKLDFHPSFKGYSSVAPIVGIFLELAETTAWEREVGNWRKIVQKYGQGVSDVLVVGATPFSQFPLRGTGATFLDLQGFPFTSYLCPTAFTNGIFDRYYVGNAEEARPPGTFNCAMFAELTLFVDPSRLFHQLNSSLMDNGRVIATINTLRDDTFEGFNDLLQQQKQDLRKRLQETIRHAPKREIEQSTEEFMHILGEMIGLNASLIFMEKFKKGEMPKTKEDWQCVFHENGFTLLSWEDSQQAILTLHGVDESYPFKTHLVVLEKTSSLKQDRNFARRFFDDFPEPAPFRKLLERTITLVYEQMNKPYYVRDHGEAFQNFRFTVGIPPFDLLNGDLQGLLTADLRFLDLYALVEVARNYLKTHHKSELEEFDELIRQNAPLLAFARAPFDTRICATICALKTGRTFELIDPSFSNSATRPFVPFASDFLQLVLSSIDYMDYMRLGHASSANVLAGIKRYVASPVFTA